MIKLLSCLLLLLIASPSLLIGASSDFKTIILSNATATAAGFLPDELILSATNTLSRPYSNTLNIDLFGANNHCEAADDVPATWQDESGTRELQALWLTWDTNNLYVAVQADIHGSLNELILLLDTNPETGLSNFTLPPFGSMIEERNLVTEGFAADMVVRVWCAAGQELYAGFPVMGSSDMKFLSAGAWTVVSLRPSPAAALPAWLLLGLLPLVSKRKRIMLFIALTLLIGSLSCGEDPVPGPPATADREYTLSNLANNSTYYWKIRATDSNGTYIQSGTQTFVTAF